MKLKGDKHMAQDRTYGIVTRDDGWTGGHGRKQTWMCHAEVGYMPGIDRDSQELLNGRLMTKER